MTLLLYALLGFALAELLITAIDYSVKRKVYGPTISDFQLSQIFGNLYDWHDLEITLQGDDVLIHNLRLTEPDRKFFLISNLPITPIFFSKKLAQRIVGKYYIQINNSTTVRIPYNSPFTEIIDLEVEREWLFLDDYTS